MSYEFARYIYNEEPLSELFDENIEIPNKISGHYQNHTVPSTIQIQAYLLDKTIRLFSNTLANTDYLRSTLTQTGWSRNFETIRPDGIDIVISFLMLTKSNIARIRLDPDNRFIEDKNASFALRMGPLHAIRVYKDTSSNSIIIFTSVHDTKLLRAVIGLLHGLLAIDVNNDYQKLAVSYATSDGEKYRTQLRAYFKKYGLIDALQTYPVVEWLKERETTLKANVVTELARKTRHIKQLENTLLESYNSHLETQERLTLLEMTKEDNTELIDYFKQNKCLKGIRKIGVETIELAVEAYLEYIDEEACARILPKVSIDENVRKLLISAFVKKECKLLVYTYIRVAGNRFDIISDGRQEIGYPHPHHMRHTCLGDNGAPLNKALINNDLITFFEQFVAAVRGFNIFDSTVVRTFAAGIKENHRNRKFIELPDGTLLSFMQWLELQNKEDIDPDFLIDNEDENEED